jgi:hypothetical protein
MVKMADDDVDLSVRGMAGGKSRRPPKLLEISIHHLFKLTYFLELITLPVVNYSSRALIHFWPQRRPTAIIAPRGMPPSEQ